MGAVMSVYTYSMAALTLAAPVIVASVLYYNREQECTECGVNKTETNPTGQCFACWSRDPHPSSIYD